MFNELKKIDAQGFSAYIDGGLLLYVESEYDSVTRSFMDSWYDRLTEYYSGTGMKFIYTPKLFADMNKRLLRYMFGSTKALDSKMPCTCVNILPDMVRREITGPSVVWFHSPSRTFFVAEINIGNKYVPECPELVGFRKLQESFEKQIPTRYEPDVRYSLVRDVEYSKEVESEYSCKIPSKESQTPKRAQNSFSLSTLLTPSYEEKTAEQLEQENSKMISAMAGLMQELQRRGYSRNLVMQLVDQRLLPPLSPLYIDGSSIFLKDYGHAELKLAPMDKAFYMLYLRHPEGINYKDMVDYKEELYQLYRSVSNRINHTRQQRTIDQFCDPTNNAMSISASRIKSAFLAIIDDSLAQNYYIKGAQGDNKYVTLDRRMVLWKNNDQ